LQSKTNNFFASLYFDKDRCGAAFVDISTGEFLVGEGSIAYVEKLLQTYSPSEVVFQKSKQKIFLEQFGHQTTFLLNSKTGYIRSTTRKSSSPNFLKRTRSKDLGWMKTPSPS
jgi:DNA mismatch repair ATPase MutS